MCLIKQTNFTTFEGQVTLENMKYDMKDKNYENAHKSTHKKYGKYYMWIYDYEWHEALGYKGLKI